MCIQIQLLLNLTLLQIQGLQDGPVTTKTPGSHTFSPLFAALALTVILKSDSSKQAAHSAICEMVTVDSPGYCAMDVPWVRDWRRRGVTLPVLRLN